MGGALYRFYFNKDLYHETVQKYRIRYRHHSGFC